MSVYFTKLRLVQYRGSSKLPRIEHPPTIPSAGPATAATNHATARGGEGYSSTRAQTHHHPPCTRHHNTERRFKNATGQSGLVTPLTFRRQCASPRHEKPRQQGPQDPGLNHDRAT